MSIQTNIDCISMMLKSDHSPDKWYDLVRQLPMPEAPDGVPLINMGYWKGVSPRDAGGMWEATRRLFRLVGETAELGPHDEAVLDAGCGYGTNAIHCMETFGPRRIVGLNNAAHQIARAASLVAARGLADRIAFQHGSALAIPQADGSFDKVVSVEAAFHFPPRGAFFREARRVLRPGGLLALADIVPVPPRSLLQRALLGVLRRGMQISEQNVYGLDRYREELEDAGFAVEHVESIRAHVFPQYPQWLLRHRMNRVGDMNAAFAAGNIAFFAYPWDYAVIRARRTGRRAAARREGSPAGCPHAAAAHAPAACPFGGRADV